MHDSETDSDHVAVAVRRELDSTGYHQLRRIDIDVKDGHVRLSGRVGRYYLVQLAQQAALQAAGVRQLDSSIQVVRTAMESD